jgi:hypothetical protein
MPTSAQVFSKNREKTPSSLTGVNVLRPVRLKNSAQGKTWGDIKTDHIVVSEDNAKTASRRIVIPIRKAA